jgi:hypothetical protein
MSWNPLHHSDQDNLTWSWLRAVEWGRWPIFLSQPLAPILLLFFDWKAVILGVVAANFLWAVLVRYQFVNVPLAYLGALFVRLKWLAYPSVAIYLFLQKETIPALVALFWPLLIFVIGVVPTTQIGRIQKMFMAKLSYEAVPTELRMLKSELANLTPNSDVSKRLLHKARRRNPKKTEIAIYKSVIEQYKKDHNR